jgi:hypothetical protein
MKCALSLVALGLAATAQAAYYEYTTVPGYFLQDEASTDPSTFDYVWMLLPLSSYPKVSLN